MAWCRDNDPSVRLSLAVSLLPPFVVPEHADADGYLREAVASTNTLGGGVVTLTSAVADRFRTMAIAASEGRVGLIEGGACVKRDWAPSVQRLTELMRVLAPSIVYGFLKRGSRVSDAILESSLPSDWPEVQHMNALVHTRRAFEDRFVPDSICQPRPPSGCRSSGAATARTSQKLVRRQPRPLHPNPYYDPFPPTPEVLAHAREDFDRLLYKDGRPPAHAEVLGERRFLHP